MVLLGMVMGIVAVLWGCGAGGSVKVSLVTTAIPADIMYVPPLVGDDDPPGQFHLTEANPTQTFTFGGIACVVQAQAPAKMPDGVRTGPVPAKLLIKTPTQELSYDLLNPRNLDANTKPLELTLDHGRKYLLKGDGSTYVSTDPETKKKKVATTGIFWSVGVQTGKIGKTKIPIALYDSNLDGFYTSGEDGIVVGSLTGFNDYAWISKKKLHFAQPLSKYISTADGIFEIQHLAKDGSELTVLPYRGVTTRLEVIAPPKCSGQIIMTSSDAKLNVTVNGKAGESVTVIPGSYTILNAAMNIPPQGSQSEDSLMFVSGEGMPAVKVEAGAKRVLVLSGPKVFEFQAAMADGKVNIKPQTLHIKGQAGETYELGYDPENLPEVYLNVDGKSTLLGKMEYG